NEAATQIDPRLLFDTKSTSASTTERGEGVIYISKSAPARESIRDSDRYGKLELVLNRKIYMSLLKGRSSAALRGGVGDGEVEAVER
ncbi:hypothetical protein HDV05_003024, partial [Chytridiales sp. JEL 0842]